MISREEKVSEDNENDSTIQYMVSLLSSYHDINDKVTQTDEECNVSSQRLSTIEASERLSLELAILLTRQQDYVVSSPKRDQIMTQAKLQRPNINEEKQKKT